MRTGHFALLIVLAFLVANCSSTKNTGAFSATQTTGVRPFHKLFIEVPTVDIEVRIKLENALAEAAVSHGYTAVKSHVVIPFSLKDLKLPTREEIELKVKENNCDAIMLVNLYRQGESIQRTPGTFREANEQIGAGLLSGILNKGGDVNKIPSVDNPGSFSHSKGGFIFHSNLYAVPGGENIFSVQSEAVDISSTDEIRNAAGKVLSQLKKKGLKGE